MKERREEKEAIEAVQRSWEWKQKEKEYNIPKDASLQHMYEVMVKRIEERNKSKEEASTDSSYRILVIIAVVSGIIMLCLLIGRFQ